ncbi:MAG: hypothetical protein V1858_02825 [Candidatus Gottesmanbacteria bacterium]
MNNLLALLEKYQTQNIIAVIALILAYLAYRKSVIDEYRSWLDLAKSFQHELNYAKYWIGNSYEKMMSIDWSNPSRFVYPLTAEAAKALIWKGHPPKRIFPDDFFDKLAIYNERIQAFNHFLMIQGINYVVAEVDNKNEKISEKAKHINYIIHNDLIGSQDNYHLHNLYNYFSCQLKMIEKADLLLIPWYFKYPERIVLATIFIYIIVDYFIQ